MPREDALWSDLEQIWNLPAVADDRHGATVQETDRTGTIYDHLTHRVRRHLLLGALIQLSEVTVTAVAALVVVRLWQRGGALDQVGALALGSLVLVALAWGLHSRRDLWRAPAQTALSHLDFLRRRCRAQRRYLWFSCGLLVFEVLLFAIWMPLQQPAPTSGHYLFLVLWSAGLLIVLLGLLMRNRNQAGQLDELADELGAEDYSAR